MDPQASSSGAAGSGDEWELVNDDGFVYRRKKRRLVDPPPNPAVNPEEEEKHRRERKRRTLLKLIKRYSTEISHWVLLSNTLSSLQNKTRLLQVQEERSGDESDSIRVGGKASSSGASAGVEDEGCSVPLVDELLAQVEAQEEIIHEVSNLCDVAEAMYDTKKKCTNEAYFQLPVWGSPRELVSSLCD